ncbi:MAG: 30S ribosomal protein S2, partial [Bacteroidales bacterium]|nr:30S ribosomal protein S2 [Bacteroidales bacterium]
DLNRLPSALFVVDVQKEINAVKEANRLNIPVIAMVDTCCDPTNIDYVIPANDDAAKSIALVTEVLCKAVAEGLEERKLEKDKAQDEAGDEAEAAPAPARRVRTRRSAPKAEAKAEEVKQEESAPAEAAPANE